MNEYVLITGASGGIGYELAKLFAAEKYNLVLVARNEDKLNKRKNEIEKQYSVSVMTIAKDLTEPGAVSEVFRQTSKNNLDIGILVNNAGFGDYAEFLNSDWNRQKNMVDLNITALMEMTYIYGNQMKKRNSGKILNISSVAAFGAGPYMSVYYASKAFVLSFSQAVAEELRKYGISVTALCLAPAETGFESAANMKNNSNMFKKLHVAKASDVAKTGYKALMRGKVIACHGFISKFMNVGSRLLPRKVSRSFAAKINGVPKN